MKERILMLRAEGKTYREIEGILNCSMGTISFHCSDLKYKTKKNYRSLLFRRKRKKEMVSQRGGKCELCGYEKCMAALDFHHINPEEKKFNIGWGKAKSTELSQEIEKCILICANCHRELHEKQV